MQKMQTDFIVRRSKTTPNWFDIAAKAMVTLID